MLHPGRPANPGVRFRARKESPKRQGQAAPGEIDLGKGPALRSKRRTLTEIARLEAEVSAGRAAHADLAARVEYFEAIARGVGAPIVAAAGPRVPAALIAAAGSAGGGPVPVALDTGHGPVIALIRPGADPAACWRAIQAAGAAQRRRRLRSVS